MTVPLALTVTFGLGAAVGALAILIVLEWHHRRVWRRRVGQIAKQQRPDNSNG
jgi:uncharacterized membrane protein